jgi:D-alanine transaminase
MRMETLACLNGTITPAEEAKVSIWDRGFLFGDAVYEVYRLYRGRRWLEEAHSARLRRSLDALDFPPVDFDRLDERINQTIQASGIQEGTVYIQITRGVAPRRHTFPEPGTPPTELIVVRPYEDSASARLRQTGVPVISQPDLRWKLCDVKSVNLLANVLACEAAHKAEAFEAILVDASGLVTEATHTSVLWVSNGRVGGTPDGHEILPGTTRQFTLRLARELGIGFDPGRISLEGLSQADEVFLVGTTIEVIPVVMLDGQPIADGRPGPVTCRLRDAFRGAVEDWLSKTD